MRSPRSSWRRSVSSPPGRSWTALPSGPHTLGSSMSGEQQAFNELPCFIAMHDRFMEVLPAVNDLYRERLGNLVGHPELGARRPAQQRGHVPRGAGHRGGPRRAQRADPARQERQVKPPCWRIRHRSSRTKAKWSSRAQLSVDEQEYPPPARGTARHPRTLPPAV